jgi:hypothetical protein
MNAWQNYVYVLMEPDGNFHWGVYPNFQKAYERLEELAKGNTIIDCGDGIQSAVFEVFDADAKFYSPFKWTKYTITKTLLTIWGDDMLITTEMINRLEQENKERSRNSKYRLKAEAI